MTYEIIGSPKIEEEYCDEFETTMVIDLKREDGVTGDVWIVAGVPDYSQGSSKAAGHQTGFWRARVFGSAPDEWCSVSFQPDEDEDAGEIKADILAAVESVAIRTHRDRYYAACATQE